jgi:glycosyltransferase involved in cell wall biosynthesis
VIENTVKSVLNQQYQHFELIIVDDGSTDNTRDIVASIKNKHPDKRILYHYKENGERAAARNYGLQNSTGEYVLFFDSDDELYFNHLSEANYFLTNNGAAEVFHLRYDIKNEGGKIISEGPVHLSPPNRQLISGNFLSCNGVFIRRDIAEANLFNEDRNLSGVEDWELWLRLAVQFPIHYVNKITSSIINHENRSVLADDKDKLITRIESLIYYVTQNKLVLKHFNSELHKFYSSCYSYISLHLSLNKVYKKETLYYLWKGTQAMPSLVFKKRFFAILKHLL